MANLMSGIFDFGRPNSSSNAMALAKYNQELDDYADEKKVYDQKTSLDEIRAQVDKVTKNMSPERREQVTLQMMMMGTNSLFDKGSEGFNKNLGQRGATLADIQKQDKSLEIANAKQKFKVENPTSEGSARLQYALAYQAQDEQGKKDFDRADRARQLVDRGTFFEDIVSGAQYPKQTVEEAVQKKSGAIIGDRLAKYPVLRRAAAQSIEGFKRLRDTLGRLDEGTNRMTTGVLGAALSYLPESEAMAYSAELETLNAQTVINTMAELKQLSPTGSTGFGAVNIAELEKMMYQWGKITPWMDPKDIRKVLARRKGQMDHIIKKYEQAFREEEEWYQKANKELPEHLRVPFDFQKGPPKENLLDTDFMGQEPGEMNLENAPNPNSLESIKDKWGLE